MAGWLLGFSSLLAYFEPGVVAVGLRGPWDRARTLDLFLAFPQSLLCFSLAVPQFPHLSNVDANLCLPFPIYNVAGTPGVLQSLT